MYVGGAGAEGKNINIGWETTDVDDAAYMEVFKKIVIPVSEEFKPEMVIVSAGFDAATGDPLGGISVSPAGFAWMTKMLMDLVDGRVVAILEGGYNLDSISSSMAAVLSVLLGNLPPPLSSELDVNPSCLESISETIMAHKSYWKCFENLSIDSLNLKARLIGNKKAFPETKEANKPEKRNQDQENPEVVGFAVTPYPWCPHIGNIAKELPPQGIPYPSPCRDCLDQEENWVCLSCFKVACSRYRNKHMLKVSFFFFSSQFLSLLAFLSP